MATQDLFRIGMPPMTDEEIERAKDAAVEEGRKAFAEGRYVAHEEVVRWLESWGTDHELPPPLSPVAKAQSRR